MPGLLVVYSETSIQRTPSGLRKVSFELGCPLKNGVGLGFVNN